MKHHVFRSFWVTLIAGVLFGVPWLKAQTFPVPVSPRQTLQRVRTQLRLLQDSTRNVPSFNDTPDALLWRQFQDVAAAFEDFKRSLASAQLNRGANDLAELDAGLAIISEAFANFQDDLSQGRPGNVAVRTLCQVLRDATKLWGNQLDQVARRLRV